MAGRPCGCPAVIRGAAWDGHTNLVICCAQRLDCEDISHEFHGLTRKEIWGWGGSHAEFLAASGWAGIKAEGSLATNFTN